MTTRWQLLAAFAGLSLTVSCAYEPPLVEVEDDYPNTVSLSGELVSTDGPETPGPAHVLLYNADNPPPPAGFGTPASLGTTSAGEWQGGTAGLISAPWSLANVASGDYLISGLVDNDVDFNPFYEFTGGATCGDQLGAYLDSLSTQNLAVLSVEAPDAVDGLTVMVQPPLTTERPAFEIGGYFLIDGTAPDDPPVAVETLARSGLPATTIQVIALDSVGIDHELLTINAPDSPTCPSAFLVTLLDEDGDGEIDPHDNALAAFYGMKKAYPKVYLRYMMDFEGAPLPAEEGSYLTEAVVITRDWTDAAYWENPANWEDPEVPEEDPVPDATPNVPFLTTDLNLAFLPLAAHIYDDDGDPSTPAVTEYVEGLDVPMGYWQVIVAMQTGQTWFVPNSMANPDLQAAYGWTDIPSQGMFVPIQ